MRSRSRRLREQSRRSVRMAITLGIMALFVMFVSMYFFWANVN